MFTNFKIFQYLFILLQRKETPNALSYWVLVVNKKIQLALASKCLYLYRKKNRYGKLIALSELASTSR